MNQDEQERVDIVLSEIQSILAELSAIQNAKWNKQTRLLWSFRNSLTVKRNLDWRANQQFHSPLIALRVYRITQGSMMRPWRRKSKLFAKDLSITARFWRDASRA